MLLDLVDVFGAAPLKGNPLAVVRGGEALDAAAMQALTDWLGFSETAFLLPATEAGADYRVRIFCPGRELPFAGHPTLGSCHAWLAAGGVPEDSGTVVQQCEAGLVRVRREGDGTLAFAAPPLIEGGPLSDEDRAAAETVAGVAPGQVVEAVHACNGPKWRLLRLASAEELLALRPAASAPVGTDVGVISPAPAGSAMQWELRAFFADGRGVVREDPVTGSLNAAAAQYLFAAGLAQGRYLAGQGRMVGADGRVTASIDGDGQVWIGGACATIAAGADLTPG